MNSYNNEIYFSQYGKKLPNKRAHEDEVWAYAISFNGYKWVLDKFHAQELEKYIKHPDNTKFLDKHHPGWRKGEGEPCAVQLIGCIGGGKILDESDFEIEELKAILFFEQRANRWHQDWPEESLKLARGIIEKIRNYL